MKLVAAIILASLAALQGQAMPTSAGVENREEQTCGSPTVALLRGYSARATDHFYTANATQMEKAIVNHAYVSEGDAAQVFSSQVQDTVPFYRLYSPAGSDHFYTTSTAQRDNAISKGYNDKGITAYVYTTNLCGTVPLYRMYNPTAVDHFYTTDETQKTNAITTHGYVDEGIAAYVNPQ